MFPSSKIPFVSTTSFIPINYTIHILTRNLFCYTNHFWSWNLYFLRSMISNRINGAWNSENKNWKINQFHPTATKNDRNRKNRLPSHTLYCIINYKTNNWLPWIHKTAWTLCYRADAVVIGGSKLMAVEKERVQLESKMEKGLGRYKECNFVRIIRNSDLRTDQGHLRTGR